MENVNEIVDKASSYFENGYNCAESTLLAVAKDGLKLDSDPIPKIATGFGGGISKQGCICGAASGAIMGSGLKYGRNSSEELRAHTYNRAVEFLKQFQKKIESILCKELLECDLSTIEGMQKLREEKVHKQVRSHFVNGAIEISVSLIDEP